jgi:hypothetical protein
MILLCGVTSDSPLTLVERRLQVLSLPYRRLDQRAPDGIDCHFTITSRGLDGELSLVGERFALGEFTGIYARLMDWAPPLGAPGRDPAVLKRRRAHDALLTWLELSPARVVNRPAPMGSNSSKPYQSQLIRKHDFAVPDTLVTNDPDLVLEFWERHQQVIFKSISSVRSIVRVLREEDRGRLEAVLWCPTQFQKRVDGQNVRVHVVGQAIFASAIATDAVDYRYAHREGHRAEVHEIDLPDDLSHRCVRLAESLELPFAGIDLIIGTDGLVYCLEVNPSPAFSYYEEQTGQPISQELAVYLCNSDNLQRYLDSAPLPFSPGTCRVAVEADVP